jgi:ABC-2 type transport system ATP-binding protein
MSVRVEIDGLAKRFGAVEALRGVSARIEPGRLMGLVGPDGAGKTTFLRLICGLLTPSAGTVRLDGQTAAADRARLVGYMPQRFGLYEDLSVLENLRLYADLRDVPAAARPAQLDRLFAFTQLGPFATRRAGQLSGGMKQKLGLACALMGAPPVLLLDEPGVGVDPVSRRDLWAMVETLTGEGVAVVWATAYLDEAERCESVLLMDRGRILHDGPPGELTARLDRRSFHIVAPEGDRRRVLARALDLPSVRDGAIEGRSIRIVLSDVAAPREAEALAKQTGARLAPAAPRFEDAFVDLLGGGPGGRSAIADRMPATPSSGAATVSCRGLTRRFGDFVAADSVTFDVKEGEILGLIGPNGAGKSTTFRMLCGLLKPSAGTARVAGLDMLSAPSAAKRRIGYMAQKFSLYGLMTVRQNLDYAAGLYGLSRSRRRQAVSEMIETFRLDPYLSTGPEALPLGYRQRLALACALMHAPAVLFLDEPTSGVDPITRREFWTHINGLVGKGVTVLVTTHFMAEAEYCDRVALMNRSRLIALDAPDALKARAATPEAPDPSMEDAFIRLVAAQAAPERRAL